MFDLDPRLASDTFDVCALPLSRVLLMNDARYPWIILVPARPGLVELHDLTDDDYAVLSVEIRNASPRMPPGPRRSGARATRCPMRPLRQKNAFVRSATRLTGYNT